MAACAGATFGCAGRLVPPPIVSEAAQLGSVVIYRNGVAFFERYASPLEKELTLRVPAERVDDFLKSLSIIDEKTNEPIPVSYPTLDASEGFVDMTIALPKGHGRLRITYVTESPAWKPSYRVVLGEDGSAKLQGWAVVDNVSGEDWKNVRIGVGSTSALSFRYDLHSVRLIERETLSSGSLLAVAPPTGGSPYASGGKKVRIVGNISQRDFGALAQMAQQPAKQPQLKYADNTKKVSRKKKYYRRPAYDKRGGGRSVRGGLAGATSAPGGLSTGSARGYGGGYGPRAVASARPYPVQPPVVNLPPASRRSRSLVLSLSSQLRRNNERVRVEGFAQAGDKDPRMASLDRANVMREQLIANGIPADRIEAVGTGKLNNNEALRVVSVEEEAKKKPSQKAEPDAAVGQPLGQAHFLSEDAMTIESDHSAMVSILNTKAQAERVFYYDPISARGSKKFAFNAVRIVNPSEYTLDSGPVTVYASNQFLGEGLSDPILPKSTAFVPYALDRSIVVEPKVVGREEIEKLLTIQRGIVTTETRRIRRTKLTFSNRAKEDAQVYMRHKVAAGYKLTPGTKAKLKPEKLGGAHLFALTVKANEAAEVYIEEWTPITKTVDIRTDMGIRDITLYLRKAKISPTLKEQLRDVVKRHSSRTNLQERTVVLGEQMAVYRQRIDEINVQLVTLKKVRQAAKLRRHLAKKMEEISNKLQEATMEMTDLKGQLMTLRIELQDRLAELTLQKKSDDGKETKKVADKE